MDALRKVLNSREKREDLTQKIFSRCMAITGDREEARDLAQETILKGLEKIHQFDGRHLYAWLSMIARNLYIDKTRKKTYTYTDKVTKKKEKIERESLPGDVPELSEHSHEEGVIVSIDLEQCMEKLEDEEREIIALLPVSSNEEISEQLEISQSNLRVKVFRARNKLAECLEIAA